MQLGAKPLKSQFLKVTNSGCQWVPVGAGSYDYRITASKAKKWVPVGAGPLKSHFLRFRNSGCQWVLVGASGCEWVRVGASGCQWVYFRSSLFIGSHFRSLFKGPGLTI